MIYLKVKGTKSWLDPLSQRALSANLSRRLWDRCKGRKGLFVTLTYRRDDYAGPLDLYRVQSEEQHVPLFLRKVSRYLGEPLKGRWFCKLEFQAGGWVHWHIIILGVDKIPHDAMTRMWGRGHVWLRRLNRRNVYYCTKYVAKDGGVPAWLYNEPPKSVKVVRVSPGFWGDTEASDPPPDRPTPRPRLPFWVPIGEKIDRARTTLVVQDDRQRFRTFRADLGPLLAALMVAGCGIVGNRQGWVAVDADMQDLAAAVRPAEGAPPAGRGRSAGRDRRPLHLIEVQNPDESGLPRWLKGLLFELMQPEGAWA